MISVEVTHRNFVYNASFDQANELEGCIIVRLHSTGGPEGGGTVRPGSAEWKAVEAKATKIYDAECQAWADTRGTIR